MTEDLGAISDADQIRSICHDLKQNIATGLLLSDLVNGDELHTAVRRHVVTLREQWAHVADLVAVLSGDLESIVRRADLAEVSVRCVDAVRAGREVTLEIEGDEHVVAGDPVLLRRALGNLLDNACRATPAEGRVSVRVGKGSSESWVEVVDEGPGLGQIAAGTGLGLEVVRAAVWKSAGRLRIDSGPRSGTTFRMTFPSTLRFLS